MSMKAINNRILTISSEATEESKRLLAMMDHLAGASSKLSIFERGGEEVTHLLGRARSELELATQILMQSEKIASEIIAIHNR